MSNEKEKQTGTRVLAVHTLKVWPEHFKALQSGEKNYELRRNDRFYNVGDYLLLCEYDPETRTFTGASLSRKVTHILCDFDGLEIGYVVMSLAKRRLP